MLMRAAAAAATRLRRAQSAAASRSRCQPRPFSRCTAQNGRAQLEATTTVGTVEEPTSQRGFTETIKGTTSNYFIYFMIIYYFFQYTTQTIVSTALLIARLFYDRSVL